MCRPKVNNTVGGCPHFHIFPHFVICSLFQLSFLAFIFQLFTLLSSANWLLFYLLGNEDVKLSILSAVASWASRSSDAIQPNLVSFIAAGLKEKEALRRGHLRCVRIICRNPDAISQVSLQTTFLVYIISTLSLTKYATEYVLQISDLLSPLIQLVKTGFTKAVQRLDGIYALLIVSKIAACDIKAGTNQQLTSDTSLIQYNLKVLHCFLLNVVFLLCQLQRILWWRRNYGLWYLKMSLHLCKLIW